MKYLVLLFPCALAVWTPLYNYENPVLLGIPFFYWFQMLVVVFSSLCIWFADWMGRV